MQDQQRQLAQQAAMQPQTQQQAPLVQQDSTGGSVSTDTGAAPKKTGVSFGSLMPFLETLVGADQQRQLNVLYLKMKNTEISREDFVRGARVVAGEKVIMEALHMMNRKKDEVPSTATADDNADAAPAAPAAAAPLAAPAASAAQGGPATPIYYQTQMPVDRKAVVGQKKPAEVVLMQPGKKQKTGNDPVQSLEQINDLAAISGVNLKEEEEHLLGGPREETRTSIEMRRKLMEEEGKYFLERGPLHAKVQEIAAKAGLKSISEDVERCLSMCTEEWLWGFLLRSIKNSKQRCGVEKGQKIMPTLDLLKTVNSIRKKQKEFRQRKEAEESERLRKLNEEKGPAAEDAATKAQKAQQQQQQDDKMRTNAANVAARKAMGVEDISSKWRFLAEQQKQGNVLKDQQDPSGLAGTVNKPTAPMLTPRASARRTALPPSAMRAPIRTVNLRDIICCLEREPRMCKSPLLYKLYEKLSSGDEA